jgi:hypothetical protein
VFEAVIEIQIKGGVPIRSSIVAFHPRRAGN